MRHLRATHARMMEPLWAMTALRRRRLELGLAQWELARRSGVSAWKVSFAERGLVILAPAERERLADALDCDERVLFPHREVQ